MPKPSGDNNLTKELLKLRGEIEPDPEAPRFKISMRIEGPNFDVSVTGSGELWVISKLADDMSESIRGLM